MNILRRLWEWLAGALDVALSTLAIATMIVVTLVVIAMYLHQIINL